MNLANRLISYASRLSIRAEGHTFAFVPERVGAAEGLRASLAIGAVLGLAIALDRRDLAFGAVAAFWNCLCDPLGTDRARLKVMGTLSLLGAVVMTLASIMAHLGHLAGGAALFVLVTLCGLTRTYGAALGPAPAATGLIASIAVVIGLASPRAWPEALSMGASFLLGAAWTIALCIFIWRIPTRDTVARALLVLFGRLEQMTAFLASLHGGADQHTRQWRELDTLYRRAMRISIERARETAGRINVGYARLDAGINAAGRVFAGLIAIGQIRRQEALSVDGPRDRLLLAGLHKLLLTAVRVLDQSTPDMEELARAGGELLEQSTARTDPTGLAVSYAARAIIAFAAAWSDQAPAQSAGSSATKPGSWGVEPLVLRHALRVATASLLAYAIGIWLDVSLSFWGVIATLIVTQPLVVNTGLRALERVAGTLAGALIAGSLIALQPSGPQMAMAIIPLSAAVIALRLVNYGLFVVFLTPMFMLLSDLIRPAEGLIAARILNEFIAASVGIVASAILWPEKERASIDTALAAAISYNMQFAAAVVRKRGVASADIELLHRQAGMGSAVLETARERIIFEGRYGSPVVEQLQAIIVALRSVCGAAVVSELLANASIPDERDNRRADAIDALAKALQDLILRPLENAKVELGSDFADDLDQAVRDLVSAVRRYANASQEAAHG